MATYIGYRDGGKTNEEGLAKRLSRLFTGGVPTGAIATSLQVSQRSSGANMSVDVAVGDVHLPNPAGTYSYWGYTDTVTNVAIDAADPTNARIDVLVAYCDLTVVNSANNNNPGALKFYVAKGTPAGTPSAVTDSVIQTALGASTPFQRLAYVYVGSGVTTITTAVITDARVAITPRTPVTTSTITNGAVTSAKLAPSKTTDANGWTVYDYGTWKEYERLYTYTGTFTSAGAGVVVAHGTTNLPAGVALGSASVLFSGFTNNQSVAVIALPVASGGGVIGVSDPSAVGFSIRGYNTYTTSTTWQNTQCWIRIRA